MISLNKINGNDSLAEVCKCLLIFTKHSLETYTELLFGKTRTQMHGQVTTAFVPGLLACYFT